MAQPFCSKFPTEQLVEMIRSGSPKEKRCAEEVLYERCRKKQIAILRSKKFDLTKEEAFDIYLASVDGAFKAIYNGTFRGESGYETYLSRIRNNKVADLFRKKYKDRPIDFIDPDDHVLLNLSDDGNIENADLWKEAKACVLRCLEEDCKKIFFWKAEGYSLAEIAKMFVDEKNEHYHTAIAVQRKYNRCFENLVECMRKNCPDLLDIIGGDKA